MALSTGCKARLAFLTTLGVTARFTARPGCIARRTLRGTSSLEKKPTYTPHRQAVSRKLLRPRHREQVNGLVGDFPAAVLACLTDARLGVFHVVLDAGEEVLRQRIQDSTEAQAWRLDHLAAYRSSRAWMIQAADLAVDTSRRTPAEIAVQIADALPDHMRTSSP